VAWKDQRNLLGEIMEVAGESDCLEEVGEMQMPTNLSPCLVGEKLKI